MPRRCQTTDGHNEAPDSLTTPNTLQTKTPGIVTLIQKCWSVAFSSHLASEVVNKNCESAPDPNAGPIIRAIFREICAASKSLNMPVASAGTRFYDGNARLVGENRERRL